IVIEESATGSPADLRIVHTGVACYIGKRPVAVIVKKNVVSPKTAEQIIPTVVVVIADANAGLPASPRQAGFRSHIGKGAIAIVFEQLRCGSFTFRPFISQASSVGEINVEPAVVIVIKEGDPAAFCFDDVTLVRVRTPDVRDIESGFFSNVDELHLTGRAGRL